MAFILLINIKMPTIFGILTSISRLDTTSESFLKQEKMHFIVFIESWNSMLSWVGHMK